MTKYDIRIKRRALSQGQIARHKDFRSLRNFKDSEDKSSGMVRIVLIIIALVLFIGMTILGIIRIKEEKPLPESGSDMEIFEEFNH
ncbi:hypothetical protein [Reichenbachiella sp. MALMAid0571]|uniref:hypothetical protein n=1 Tax=Reichenbachiella sp. MALMAid0571 TaxID=3143939 RepID=UPI0032DE4DC1